MPYYYRRKWNRYRRRYWNYRWRPRAPIRRRRRWRKRQPVRRKLQKLTLKEWQPKQIRKSCIKGLHCLFIVTEDTISRNYRMYEHSFTGEHWPSGGGFSVTKYTLDGLYEQHQLDRNWWTKPNTNMPLVRYLGCKLTFYQSWEVDYVCNINLTWPMVATNLLYLSCHPNFMMMNHKAIFVPSKITKRLRRGKKTVRLRPPHQMINKWYFAKELAKTGLVMLTAAAASFDHYYIGSDKLSNNCTFTSLNPLFYKRHDFITPPVQGYILSQDGTIEKKLFSTTHVGDVSQLTIEQAQLTYLGDTKMYEQTSTTHLKKDNADTYFTTHKNWGNPFSHENLTTQENLLITNKSYQEIITKAKDTNSSTNKIGAGFFTSPSEVTHYNIRYAPDRDTGIGNKIYLKSVGRDTSFWDPPHDEELICSGFPIWSLLYGFVSWQVKLGHVNNIYRSHILVIETTFFKPQLAYYIPIDQTFLEGNSAYMPEQGRTDDDNKNWYPCLLYQLQAIETIVRTGPGIPKLGGRKSAEAKIKYAFYFKFGGCPPKMDTIDDPTKQETYPLPGIQPSTYSLQNPTYPQEYYLYQFDEKDGVLTERAAKRIRLHKKTQKALLSTTGAMDPAALQTQATTDSEEDEETDPTLLRIKLRHLRRQRQQLEQQIERLIQP
nr:MAG: ORF1 [TTV-like mini virus]UGV38913.1 MAG: ORF1 [TTV-like mini virus]